MILLLAIGRNHEIALDEAMKLMEENDGSTVLVVSEEVVTEPPQK
jgi:hypothetical protein